MKTKNGALAFPEIWELLYLMAIKTIKILTFLIILIKVTQIFTFNYGRTTRPF